MSVQPSTQPAPTQTTSRQVPVRRSYENTAWRWMRYSAIILIPLAWFHVILNDVIVGVHAIDLDLVAARWANLGSRVFSALLLGFAFAHGMNGLRQVLDDFIQSDRTRQLVGWLLLLVWFVITALGAIALIAGVRQA